MSMLPCPYCANETSDEYNFCLHCEKQIKCLNRECEELLIPEKSFCFHCGQPVGAVAISQTQNRFTRRVTQQGKDYTELTELTVSDQAVNVFAPLVMNELTSPGYQRPYYAPRMENTQRPQPKGAIAERSSKVDESSKPSVELTEATQEDDGKREDDKKNG